MARQARLRTPLDVGMELAAVYDDVPALPAVAADSGDGPAIPIP